MYEAVQKCTYCGANLTLDDLRKPDCPYCRTVFPHRAQAAQHAELAGQVMNQMMAQQAQIQNAWRGGFGLGPMPGMPPGAPGMPVGIPGGPPPGMPAGLPPGVPVGAPPGMYGSPYADPARLAAYQMQQVNQAGRRITIVVALVVGGILVMSVGIAVAVFLAAAR